jgi:hypothetical protein
MMKNTRRDFIKVTGMAGIALTASGMKGMDLEPGESKEIKFLSPVDGDMLNEYDGIEDFENLIINVKISAPAGSRIKVNGVRAEYTDGIYLAEVKLKGYSNFLELHDGRSKYRERINVFWLKNYTNRYRFSIDDNIWFLQDITKNADRYTSLFDNPYLGFLRKVHDTYGTKFHLNIYYQTDGFNLSQMTAKFRDEWKANAGWLGLSFHALANDPDRPYIKASYAQVEKDCALVKDQIKRFAGEEVMGPETTLHWGEGTVEACRALKDAGYIVLAGYFNVDDKQAPVSYYLTEDQRRHLKKRFIWRDNKEGLTFARIALVVNTVRLDEIVPYLDNVRSTFNPRYIDLMIHEQYFYPHYVAYQPDWGEKVITAVKWAVDNGYQPAFLKESVF